MTTEQHPPQETSDPQPSKTDTPKVVIKPLLGQNLTLEQHGNNSWMLVVQAGSQPSDYHMNPDPFEFIADQFRRFDSVKLVDAGGKFWAEALVVNVDARKVYLHVLRQVDLVRVDGDQTDVPRGFEVRLAMHHEGQRGWVVIRRSDGVLMNKGWTLNHREDAIFYIRGHNAA